MDGNEDSDLDFCQVECYRQDLICDIYVLIRDSLEKEVGSVSAEKSLEIAERKYNRVVMLSNIKELWESI